MSSARGQEKIIGGRVSKMRVSITVLQGRLEKYSSTGSSWREGQVCIDNDFIEDLLEDYMGANVRITIEDLDEPIWFSLRS